MKVLIMAAGVGSRISRSLQGQPKCCVDINGKPLIQNTMDLLINRGIDNIAIVTGYQERYIHQALEGYRYTHYFNPFFRVANSISSVWFSRNFLTPDDELMIMNGDVFFEEKVLDVVLEEKNSPVMLSDSSRIEDADYRFTWEENLLTKYGKELNNSETTGEYVGIGKLSKNDLIIFKQQVIDYVEKEDYNCWWEDVLYRMIHDNKKVYVHDIKGLFWAEVDYIEDYERIKAYIIKK